MQKSRFVSIGEAAKSLGVFISTLRRWETQGRLRPERTPAGHCRYDLNAIEAPAAWPAPNRVNDRTIAYARASSHDQRDDLQRQKQVLELYCAGKGWNFEILSDLGSGMNCRKKRLVRLLNLLVKGEINRLVITHKADPEHVKAPNEGALRRQFGAIKRERFPWTLEVSKCAPLYAIKEFGRIFANHFKNPRHCGWPTFKKKFVNDSFSISNDQFKIEGSRIRIPNLGWVRMCEPLRFKGAKVLRATISRAADEWYVSITCELSDLKHLKLAQNHGRVGVDLGIGKPATLSDGHAFEAPRPLKESLRRLKRLQRSFPEPSVTDRTARN